MNSHSYGRIGYGMTNGSLQLFDINVEENNNSSNSMQLNIISNSSNITSNKWYFVETSDNEIVLTLPSDSLNGEIIKLTKTSSSSIFVNGQIKGNTSDGFNDLGGSIELDIPVTLTFMYIQNYWNLIEINKL